MSPIWWILIVLIVSSPVALLLLCRSTPNNQRRTVTPKGNSTDPVSDLESIFSRFSDRIGFYFCSLPIYDNAFVALPAFLLVFSRYSLILNGQLHRGDSKTDAALLSAAKRTCRTSDLDKFGSYLSYFQSFLVPDSPLPRCEFLYYANSFLDEYPRNGSLILLCALGDSIVNPDIVQDSDAGIYLRSAFQCEQISLALKDQVSPALADFTRALYAHFSRFSRYYSA